MHKIRRTFLLLLLVAALVALAAAAVPPPNLEKALAAQRALVAHQPSAERWNDLGNLLELGGHEAEARDAYEKALALDARLVSAHYNLGLLLRQDGEARQAMDHFRQVVELDPDDGWGWFQIGALAEARGAEGAAVDAYARAYALDPRLTFGDVNPQVIDSKLTTQALLRAQQVRPQGSEAPRAYEDPRHIAKLLLPQQPAPGATPAPATAPPEAVTAAPGVDTKGKPPAEGRVLRPQDLRSGSAGGVLGGAPQGREPMPDVESPGYSDLLRQQLELQQQQQQELEGGGEGVPPTGLYVPGVRSSGQISQRIDDLPA